MINPTRQKYHRVLQYSCGTSYAKNALSLSQEDRTRAAKEAAANAAGLGEKCKDIEALADKVGVDVSLSVPVGYNRVGRAFRVHASRGNDQS